MRTSSVAENAGVLCMCAAVLLGGWCLDAEDHGARIGALPLPSVCFLRDTPLGSCPGCGLTRSVVAVCHLRWKDSLGFHPGGCVLVGIALVQGIDRLRCIARNRRPDRRVAGLTRGAMLVVLCSGLLVWATRLLGG